MLLMPQMSLQWSGSLVKAVSSSCLLPDSRLALASRLLKCNDLPMKIMQIESLWYMELWRADVWLLYQLIKKSKKISHQLFVNKHDFSCTIRSLWFTSPAFSNLSCPCCVTWPHPLIPSNVLLQINTIPDIHTWELTCVTTFLFSPTLS